MTSPSVWRGRNVLVTGHTGFKGSWLAAWLHELGAHVHGYSLEPPTNPSMFEEASIASMLASDERADIRDTTRLAQVLARSGADMVFHLAAQPLVRASYSDPLETISSNVQGTASVLEALRGRATVRAAIVITTDKVYDNQEWSYPYRETDRLGGHDLYAASKAAAEIVTDSYRRAFFWAGGDGTRVATARAGNVIGGGDWARDRLVPDCLRAYQGGEPARLRYPDAVRPWQHVLEPLSGYIVLAERLLESPDRLLQSAWNFGPDAASEASVGDVARRTATLWSPTAVVEVLRGDHPHEANLLRLDSSRARSLLGWSPRWSLDEALQKTVEWQRSWMERANMLKVTRDQIRAYQALAS